jgi:pSer/pThr/pTyr-binding forkhead associated (FHA) protein
VDLGSTNGTFVDGERVSPQGAPLADGSRITIGRTRIVVRFGSW